MECVKSVSVGDSDEVLERIYTLILTHKISKNALKKFQLRYIPDYIRELRNKKNYWEEEYRKYQDDKSLKNWRSFQTQFKDEVNKHKTILKNLDYIRNGFVHSGDRNHFSLLIDPERVQAKVDYLKENQSDHDIFDRLVPVIPDQPKDFDNIFYIIYAIWAFDGEFRIRPPGSTGVQVKED